MKFCQGTQAPVLFTEGLHSVEEICDVKNMSVNLCRKKNDIRELDSRGCSALLQPLEFSVSFFKYSIVAETA